MTEWGRVSDDGTVFVRTADGERAVGSWQAGTPEAGLAHFGRRFEQLATEVALLEQRIAGGVGDPAQVAASAQRLKDTLPTAAAVGDLAGLEVRVDALLEKTAGAVEQAKAARAVQREAATARKTALVEEAEQLGESSEWKTAGERLRAFGQEWKQIHGVDRKTDQELWERIATARKRFAERRSTHFAALESQRDVSKGRKERLISQAEALATSTDWKNTADRFKQLMNDWKAAGRAPREVEEELWSRFKTAQDGFFTARSAQFAEQDKELEANQAVKEKLLAEAEALDPEKGDASRKRMRQLQESWNDAGKVPRGVMRQLEDRFGKIEETFRQAATTTRVAASESTFVVRLREKVADLEAKLAKATAAGRPTEELEAQLQTQRQWLAQAGAPAEPEPASDDRADTPSKRSTTAWVRAE